jgi:hypothetical protein
LNAGIVRQTVVNTFRFALIAVGLSALTFVGISWGNKGFPVMAMRIEPLKPDARIPTFEENVKKGFRRDWEESKTSQSDGNKERDRLRLMTLQAATAYELSPCDSTMKKNLIEAMTAYTKAWAQIAGCQTGVCDRDVKKIDAAAAAFTTPADKRLHEALRKAIDKGGINRDEFPRSIRPWVMQWSGMPFGEQEACIVAQQAGNRR